jgi:chromosome partitioning protein
MRITGIISDKGGDTKTTTTNALTTGINYLYPKKCKALAITNEPSGHLPLFYGLNSEEHPTTYHIAKKEVSFTEAIQQTNRGDIINGNGTLNWMDELWKTTEERNLIYGLLKNGLKEVESTYTHAIIDCKPLTSGTLIIQALTACTDVIVPMKASVASLKSLLLLHRAIMEMRETLNPQLRIAGILITRFRNTKIEKDNIQSLKTWSKINNTKVYNTIIPDGVGIEEAQGLSESIFEYKYGSGKDKPAKAYIEFIKEYQKDGGELYGK